MTKENSKIEPQNITIEKLDNKHDLSNFKSYEKELKNFLIEDALNNQKQKLSVTFLWFYENKLIGYVTLLNDKINLEGNLKEFFSDAKEIGAEVGGHKFAAGGFIKKSKEKELLSFLEGKFK